MAVKEMARFSKYSTEDFGLNPTDTDAHVPQFFMLKKWPKDAPAATRHQIFHPYSAEGQDKKWERQKAKKQRSRQAKAKARDQAKMQARAAAKAAAASASSAAAASVNQPLWLRPEPIAEETEPGLPSGSEEDSHSMSSGLQEQAEAYEKGKGKGTASSSAPSSQTNERGPGLASGPRNRTRSSGKGRRKGKGKSGGKDKGWDMSLAMPVREKGKGKAMPPWWQDHMDHWVVAGQPPQIPAEYLRYTETEEQDPQALPPYWWIAEPRSWEGSEGSEGSESGGVYPPGAPESNTGVPSWFLGAPGSYTGAPTMFERYGVDTDELPTYREMGLELDSDNPELDGAGDSY